MIPLPPVGKDKDFFPVYFKVRDQGHSFNCWGFVAKVAGWCEKFAWLDEWQMMNLLQSNAEQITDPQEGDIVAFFCGEISINGLTHTAFYRGDNCVLHKMGSCPLSEDSLDYAKRSYGNTIVFYRIKNLTKEQPVVVS